MWYNPNAMSIPVNLKKEFENLPDGPGVYIFKDDKSNPIYIGKALSLKKRVRSYFQGVSRHPPKTAKMVERVDSIDYLLTDSEIEALILESTLIKRHKPKYNVSLRDDKSYPFIAISLKEDYPKVMVLRGEKRNDYRYFGPYVRAQAMREALDTLRKIFPLRTCSNAKFNKAKKDGSSCLYAHLKICSAPCIGAITKDDYSLLVADVIAFLEGRYAKVVSALKRDIETASKGHEYERAAMLRDKIWAIEEMAKSQKMILSNEDDHDYVAIAAKGKIAVASVLHLRAGKMVGAATHELRLRSIEGESIASAFIKQFYFGPGFLPKKIFVLSEVEDKELIEAHLRKKRGNKVEIVVPRQGIRKRLVELAAKNAAHALDFHAERLKGRREENTILEDLKAALKLKKVPSRIEAYDVSTLMGKDSVASMVVFEEGLPLKADYRRFKIDYDMGMNDVAMIEEVIRRRFARYLQAGADPFSSFAKKPDLILVDGGPAQLAAAKKALSELGLEEIGLISLAKREEEIYSRGISGPIKKEKDDPALKLLIRLRDEAHRFALNYQVTLRSASMLSSALEGLPKIGPKRRRMLIDRFKTVDGIIRADLADLERVLSKPLAKDLFEHLRKVRSDG